MRKILKQILSWNTLFIVMAMLLSVAAITASACSSHKGNYTESDSGPDTDTDTDTDTDSDVDADTDADSDADTDPECDGGVDDKYQWHAFYGEDNWDDNYSVSIDGNGDVIVSGSSELPWSGPGGEPPLHAHSGGDHTDLFVLKLDADGTYLWHTFYGATGSGDVGSGIVTDAAGEIYVSGAAFDSWSGPGGEDPLNAFSMGGNRNAYVLNLSSSGDYEWHTFHGPSIATEISIDDSGDLYVSGRGDYNWLGPGGENPLHPFTISYDQYMLISDAFVLKLNSSGSYLWHTFYGSASGESAYNNTVDESGNVYIAGFSGAPWDGPAGESPLQQHDGTTAAFVLKLNSNGDYGWHYFFTAYQMDSIQANGSGYLYLTGSSEPWDGPGSESPLHPGSGDIDVFVMKLGVDGTYQWHTFYGRYTGQDGLDSGAALMAAAGGDLYVTGFSMDEWYGPDGECPVHAHSGWGGNSSGDAFILKLDADGGFLWHTFYGADSDEVVSGRGIAEGIGGELFVSGVSDGTWEGPAGQSPIHFHDGEREIFVLKLLP